MGGSGGQGGDGALPAGPGTPRPFSAPVGGVPALSEWALTLLCGVLLAAGVVTIHRKREGYHGAPDLGNRKGGSAAGACAPPRVVLERRGSGRDAGPAAIRRDGRAGRARLECAYDRV